MSKGNQAPSHRKSGAVSGKIASKVAAADASCRERGVTLTPIRRSVLEILWRAGRPMGAYDVLGEMQSISGGQPKPTTVYRALDFLLEQGIISRIESKNAYVPCAHPDHAHACVFLICEHCGESEEIENPGLEKLLIRNAVTQGFQVTKSIVELKGTCAKCLASPKDISAASL
jgi:Fur family zinc uptake transcriptional regulator